MTASRFELVIFDCDCVLIDSEPIANRVHAQTLAGCGYAVGEEELQDRFCGISDAEMLATIEREWGRALPDDYARRIATALARQYRCSLKPIAGIAEALAGLSQPVCVASSGTPERIRLGLETVGLYDRFHPHLFSASMVRHGKPAPDLFLYAAARMGAAPERCLVIEDSPAGIEAARAAGMTAIGFCGGSHCRPGHAEKLKAGGAALVIADMGELATAMAALSYSPNH
jgi:HAD superfamily hydrolase (TIGR01509 family)